MEIHLNSGVTLVPIPVSPNDDYMAGTDGNIYSRTRYKGFGRKEYVAWYSLRGHRTKKGYSSVSLCHDNHKVTKSVHRLVCMAFHGMPDPLTLQTRHLNGDLTDNRPENLAWGTQYDNWRDRRAHGHGSMRSTHPQAKLTEEECTHLKWAVHKGLCSRRHAAQMLGMSQSSISAICRGIGD